MNRKELKKAFDEGLIDKEKYQDKLFELEQAPKKSRKASRIYDPIKIKEFVRLIKATKKDIHRLAFVLAMGSGLRISEIVGGLRDDGTSIPALTEDKVNMKTKIIMLRSAKGKKDRRTLVHPKWLKEKDLKLLPIKIGERALEKAFTRLSLKCGINEIIDYYKKKNKKGEEVEIPIYRLKFHSLRRGFVSELLRRGVPVNVVAELAGHSNLSTTNKYAKSKVEDEVETVLAAWEK